MSYEEVQNLRFQLKQVINLLWEKPPKLNEFINILNIIIKNLLLNETAFLYREGHD